MLAIFGVQRGRLRTANVKPRPRRNVPPPPSLEVGPMQWLDEDAERAWEGTLGKAELEKWTRLKEAVADVGAEMRWRLAGRIMRGELERARKALQVCRNITQEPYKADLVKRNGIEFRRTVELLESRLAPLYEFLTPLAGLLGDVDSAFKMMTGQHVTLVKVMAPWNDAQPGASRGGGIPGYDTSGGVERTQRRIKRAHERYAAEQSKKGEARRARVTKKKKGKKARFGDDSQETLA